MTRIVTIAAALALMTSGALAQTDAPPAGETPPAAGEMTPTTEQMGEVGAAPPEQTREDRRERRAERRARREQRAERRGRQHDRMYRRHHAMGGMGNQGAVFSFNSGEGGPRFRIRCAAADTTQECAQAIMPVLDMVLPADEAAAAQ